MAGNQLDAGMSEEALAKAQIARRLGLGFVVITVLLGLLFMADFQFSGGERVASTTPGVEPPVTHRTIRTPENREGVTPPIQPETTETTAGSPPVVGGQVTPLNPPAGEQSLVSPQEPAPTVVAGGGARGKRESAGRGDESRPTGVARSKPTPGVVPTVPLRATPAAGESGAGIVPPSAPVSVEPRKILIPRVQGQSNGYVVQAGVFSNPQKAEELHALLTLNGIPSTLETRVHVGPFSNKAEADAARTKLKSLGVESLLLPPRK